MPIHTLRDLDLLEQEGASSSHYNHHHTTTNNKNNNNNSSNTTNTWSSKQPPDHNGPSLSSSNNMTIHHIPNLPQSDLTLAMLKRIHNEFYPIVQRRGYHVLSISEMCCCGDGLDFVTTSTRGGGRRRKQRRRIMASNILGYNQTRDGHVHTIHLRLRKPCAASSHHHHHNILYDYEHVAGTMAHELAHCEYSAHNTKFYKLMDELLEQHAVLLTRGFIINPQDGFPMNSSSQSYILGRQSGSGGGGGSSHRPNYHGVLVPATATAAAAQAAEQRQRRNHTTTTWMMPQGPQVLGGDNEFCKLLRPQEAAGMAAEMRRLRDEQWCCHPCPPEVVVLEEEEDDTDNTTTTTTNSNNSHPENIKHHHHHNNNNEKNNSLSNNQNHWTSKTTTMTTLNGNDTVVKKKRKLGLVVNSNQIARKNSMTANGMVDLTMLDSSDDDQEVAMIPSREEEEYSTTTTTTTTTSSSSAAAAGGSNGVVWSCDQCTFLNQPPMLVCYMCSSTPQVTTMNNEMVLHKTLQQDKSNV